MRSWWNRIVALVPACSVALVFTLVPVESKYTAGIVGRRAALCAGRPGG